MAVLVQLLALGYYSKNMSSLKSLVDTYQAESAAEKQVITDLLLELNLALAEDEAGGAKIQGPGLPACVDAKDPRFFSTDCIEPPLLPNADASRATPTHSSSSRAPSKKAATTRGSKKGVAHG